MKKVVYKLVLLMLIFISLGTSLVKAEDVLQEDAQKTEAMQNAENIKAKVIEAGEKYERDNATGGKEFVQNVKVKILEGDKKDEKFDTVYVLTYDIDNKIVGYKLKEGNTVYVLWRDRNSYSRRCKTKIHILVSNILFRKYNISWKKKRYKSNNWINNYSSSSIIRIINDNI